jgi:hypothetical protein
VIYVDIYDMGIILTLPKGHSRAGLSRECLVYDQEQEEQQLRLGDKSPHKKDQKGRDNGHHDPNFGNCEAKMAGCDPQQYHFPGIQY